MTGWNDHRRMLVCVLVAVCVVRTATVWVLRDRLNNDVDNYRGIAIRLANGEGYSSEGGLATAFRPPLYPLVLSASFAVGLDNTGIALLHILMGTATAWLTAIAGRRLGMSPSLAALAALLVGLDPLLLLYSSQPMTETPAALLGAALACVALAPASTRRGQSAVGVLFGMSVLCRPSFWVFGVLCAGAWTARQFSQRQIRVPWWILVGTTITVTPWVIRNINVFDKPIVMTTHGGYTLLLGNNPVFTREVVNQPWGTRWGGESLTKWQDRLETEMAAEDTPPRTEPERDRWCRDRAVAYIRQHPADFIRACGLRFVRFWNVTPPPTARQTMRNALDGIGFQQKSATTLSGLATGTVTVYYSVVFLLLLYGILLHLMKRCPAGISLTLLVLSFVLVHFVFWSNARMRAPVVPAVTVLALSCFRRQGDAKPVSLESR